MAGIVIPRYDESVVKNQAVEAGPRAQGLPATAFGSALGEGLGKVAAAGFDIAGEQKRQDDQTKAYNFRVELDDHENTIKFGDQAEDGSEGFLKIEGAESMQFKDAYLSDFKEKAYKAIPNDVSPHIRLGMEKMAEERLNSLTREFNLHAIAQETKANDAATGAMESSILRNISNNVYDDNRFQLELATLKHVVQEDVIKKYGEGNEQSNAILKSRLELAADDAYSKRLDRMLLDDPSKAKQYLDDISGPGGMSPAKVDHYTQALKPLVSNQNGIQAAFDMIPRLKNGEAIDALIAEGQKSMQKRPEEFRVFEAQMRSAQSDIQNASIHAAKSAATPVQKMIIEAEKNGGKADPATVLNSPEYKSLIALGTPEALTLASGYSDKLYSEHHAVVTEQRAINNEIRRDRNERRREAKLDALGANQAKKEAQQLEFTNLSLTPDAVASMDDFDVAQKVIELGPRYGEQFRKLKSSLTSPEKLAQVKIDTKTFNGLMEQLGVGDKKKQADYYVAAQDYLVAHQQEGKRVFTPDQMRKAIIGAFQDVKVNERNSFLGLDMGTSTSMKKRIDVQNPAAIVIPESENKLITEGLALYGLADTPKNRIMAYDRILQKQGADKIKAKR